MIAAPDSSLLLQIQVALIGIVIVIGIFYCWRYMNRIEDKLERVMEQLHSQQSLCSSKPGAACGAGWSNEPLPEIPDSDMDAAKDFMNVFGRNVLFVPMTEDEEEQGDDDDENADGYTAASPNVVVEEETAVSKPDDLASEAETESMNPLSKSKMKRMNHEQLKELCRERGLSTEGVKQVMIDRLLGLTRE